ncbi:type III polyketide synthase [Daejeonella lutea]|uniref:Predicted naringenin-chalcone synthase n=1 Tax=Daejeonella lutea TaxID=572036 RepID=A0A1T5DUW8_9SPHI|nr:type III polyketide synthase [Daejeonella lutea]SKB75451.1 Predicted naringenin-chalcone synthase [Daejeonella lutea]
MSSCISAIGTANPEYRTSQKDIYQFMVEAFDLDQNNASRLKLIYDNSGIEHRFSVLPDFGKKVNRERKLFQSFQDDKPFPGTASRMDQYQEKAAGIAAAAAKKCLEGFDNNIYSKITHLITVSCTGMYAPGIDINLVELLGLNHSVERTCINFMGCYGALNALKTADYICRAQENAKVLIVCIELCTLHFQKENTLDNWVANSLFSDGAAAALVESSCQRYGTGNILSLDTFYSEFIPAAKNEMGWNIGDNGFEMKLTSKVSKLILKHIPAIVSKTLEKAGMNVDDVNTYAIHPGGRKILEAAETALGFSKEKNDYSYQVLRDFGNMSSASILFVLEKILTEKTSEEKTILGCAFGPGLTVESMILKRDSDARL